MNMAERIYFAHVWVVKFNNLHLMLIVLAEKIFF